MARIRSANTAPEETVGAFLRKNGFRLRLHTPDLPGKPDILIPDCRTAIFVNGCFWHGHSRCKRAGLPSTRPAFWQTKIAGNVRRDRRTKAALKKLGWYVVTVWQCQLTSKRIARRFKSLLSRIQTFAEASR